MAHAFALCVVLVREKDGQRADQSFPELHHQQLWWTFTRFLLLQGVP